MNPATASASASAVRRVFAVLDTEQAKDLRNVDLDEVLKRFATLNQNIGAASINTYRSRIEKAISYYQDYQHNPNGWHANRKARAQVNRSIRAKSPTSNRSDSRIASRSREKEMSGITTTFPLREDVLITISGLPWNLKMVEAKRLAAFIQTLSQEFSPNENPTSQ